jgi:hypothetical protein
MLSKIGIGVDEKPAVKNRVIDARALVFIFIK